MRTHARTHIQHSQARATHTLAAVKAQAAHQTRLPTTPYAQKAEQSHMPRIAAHGALQHTQTAHSTTLLT